MEVPFISDFASPDQVNTVGNTSGNMVNGERKGGLLATQGEWMYFAARNENDILYKMNLINGELEKVCDDSVSSINVAGEFIYYCDQNDGNKLCRIRTDGSEQTQMLSWAGKVYAMNAAGDKLFISVRDKDGVDRIFVLNADTFEIEQNIERSSEIICTTGDSLYFVDALDGNAWYRLNIGIVEITKV